ncbi:glycosyltransferase family 4 protein [Aureimonas sp. ME7]|uniref:glycosyltransferase family 4 protein n=1 Tax=Aureimonas sp. ME7 TaxID=2744252 RepID=UPI0015F5CB8B|nr:glycosyltransferase family 4 protein [Aureimonas sp. ME7]
MHLLFVSSLLPERKPATGFEIANTAIARAYEANGARVTFAGFRRPGAERPAGPHVDLGELLIENAEANGAQKLGWLVAALRSGLPVGAAKLRTVDERDLLARIERAGPFDALVLSSVQMPIAYPALMQLGPTIFVAHNVEHRSAAEMGTSATSPATRLLYRREARLLRAHEAWACKSASAVHSLSATDAADLGLSGDRRSVVLPLTVGHGTSGLGDAGLRAFDVVLIGTWSWAPNRVGVDWFVHEVAPRLDPALAIGIAGRFDGAPPPAPGSVRFLGRVPDAQAFLRSGRVVALPMRGGTGVQLKTIETLEEGLPAVATSSSLRGIGTALPSNIRVADDAAAFADALTELVARERAGEPLRLDGQAFAARQRAELERGVRRGLELAGLSAELASVPSDFEHRALAS